MSVVLGGTLVPGLVDKEMTALPDDPCNCHLPTQLHGSIFGASIQLVFLPSSTDCHLFKIPLLR